MSLFVLLKKEWMEANRSYKILTAPIVFLFLSMLNILMLKKLPDLLTSSASNLPKGTLIQIPQATGLDALSKVISQFDSMGFLIVVLLFMGSVAGERASGVQTSILIKPVSRMAYIGAKYVIAMLLITASFFLSLWISWFYIQQLFPHSPTMSEALLGSLLFLPKLLVGCAMVLFFSSLCKSSILAGGLSFVFYLLMGLFDFDHWLKSHSPNALTNIAIESYKGLHPNATVPVLLSLFLILIFFIGSYAMVHRRID